MVDYPPDNPVAYAPIPVSSRETKLRFGSWFQSRPTAVKIAASLGVGSGVLYLTWRLVITSQGIDPWVFWPLYLAEVFGFLTFLMLVYEGWSTPATPRPPSIDLKTDIVIVTYNEDSDVVEPTIVGALAIRGNIRIWLCDDGKRPEMELLAARYGIEYQTRVDNSHAKAGNINAVLPKLEGELVLVLDADHVPSPDVLEALSGYFVSPNVALVQSAHSFRNHNSVMHEETGRHEQSMFFDVLLPGRNRLDSAFWCGSAALIRLSALREVGGVATKTSTEDFETSLLLQIKGYDIRYHNEHLIQGLAPDNLPAYILQRARWAQGTLSAFRFGYALPVSRKLKITQRISYLGTFLYYMTPIQRITYTAYVILVGFFGVIPVAVLDLSFLFIWLSYLLLTVLAISALQRGTTHPFEGLRNTFLSLEPFIRALPMLVTKKVASFKVTPKNEVDLGGWASLTYMRLPVFIITINIVVVGLRWFDYALISTTGQGFLPELPVFASIALTFFGVTEFIVIALLAKRLFSRRQYRSLWRFPVRVAATVNGVAVSVVDLHQRGLAVYAPKQLFETKMEAPIELQLVDVRGNPVLASGVFYPKNRSPLNSNLNFTRVGGEVIWNTDQEMTSVIEYCYVVQPYQAKNRFWARSSPRAKVLLGAELAGMKATAIDLSVGGVGFKVKSETGLDVGAQIDAVIWVGSEMVRGRFVVRDSRTIGENLQRIGGEVEWESTGWLNQFITFEHRPQKASAAIHSLTRR